MKQISIIKWGNSYSGTYSYGSEIIIAKENVKFSSPMMPVGAKIKTWNSAGNYSNDRISPTLPLLLANSTYKIELYIEKNNKNNVQTIIEFYDKSNQKIGIEYFDGLSLVFTYPAEAVSYTVNLINHQHELIVFSFMTISEIEEWETVELSKNYEGNFFRILSSLSEKEEIEVMVSPLDKVTTILTPRHKSSELCLLINEKEETFIYLILELLEIIRNQKKMVIISYGEYIASIPDFYQNLSDILRKFCPNVKIINSISVKDDSDETSLKRFREVRKYSNIILQMLQRKEKLIRYKENIPQNN